MEHKYNTFWPRFWSSCIDGLIFLPLSFITNYFYNPKMSVAIIIGWHLLNTFIYYVYSVYLHGRFGQTLGKMVFKVKVMDISETRPINFKQALYRDSVPLVFAIIFLPFEIRQIINGTYFAVNNTNPDALTVVMMCVFSIWGVLELITMLFNSRRRSIHDFIAGSIVVRCSEKESQ